MTAEISGVNGSEFYVNSVDQGSQQLSSRDRRFQAIYANTPDDEIPTRRVLKRLARDRDFVDSVSLQQENGVLDDVPAPKRVALLEEHISWTARSRARSMREHPSNTGLSELSGAKDGNTGVTLERQVVVLPVDTKHITGEARTRVRTRALDGLGLPARQQDRLHAIIRGRTNQLARLRS